MQMKILILILAVVGVAHSQVITVGSCPDVQVVQNFDAKSYLGNWYEASRYFTFFEIGTKCCSATYSLNSNGSVNVLNKAVSELSGASQSIEGSATFIGNGTEGRLRVSFPTTGAVAEYLVIGTDYKNWAAVFSCTNLGGAASARFAWLLTRERPPSQEVLRVAKAAFTSQGITTDIFIHVNQENCPQL